MKANLRINGGEFEKTLQDDQDLTTGRLDTRFSGPKFDPLRRERSTIRSPWRSHRRTCRFSTTTCAGTEVWRGADVPAMSREIEHWVWEHHGPGGQRLDRGTERDGRPRGGDEVQPEPPRAARGAGYFDLATPFYEGTYEEKHLPIPASLAKNIEYDWYESGHMVYVRDECRKQLHDRVAAFIKGASGGR